MGIACSIIAEFSYKLLKRKSIKVQDYNSANIRRFSKEIKISNPLTINKSNNSSIRKSNNSSNHSSSKRLFSNTKKVEVKSRDSKDSLDRPSNRKLLFSFRMNNSIRNKNPTPQVFYSNLKNNSKDSLISNDNNDLNNKADSNTLIDAVSHNSSGDIHAARLQRALSFHIPETEASFYKADKYNNQKKIKTFAMIDEADSKKIDKVTIQTHDYVHQSSNQRLTRFHSFSRKKFEEDLNEDDNEDAKFHTCDLCSMTFENDEDFINHTQFSKIHEIALLQYRARTRTKSATNNFDICE